MSFTQAISTCFSKYVGFEGRAPRSEYWYWVLFIFIAQVILVLIDNAVFSDSGMQPLSGIFSLATILPGIAVTARRLHDRDRSGWWQLIVLIPIIGWIVMLIWVIPRGTEGDNRFGPDPIAGAGMAEAAA